MKKVLLTIALASLLAGCVLVGGTGDTGDLGGNPNLDRGTTGVSSGAESGPGITGSDVFASP